MIPFPTSSSEEKLARETAQKVAALEERVSKLSTLCNALLTTFQNHTGFSEEEFLAIVNATEKKQKQAVGCTQCGEILQRGLERCMYCGTPHAHTLGKMV